MSLKWEKTLYGMRAKSQKDPALEFHLIQVGRQWRAIATRHGGRKYKDIRLHHGPATLRECKEACA